MSPDDIVTEARRYLDQGVMGIKMKIGHPDPEDDARRLQRVFDSLGDEVWFAVDANQRYDYSKALLVGRFLDEEIRPDWFEEPLPCDDVDGHARLAERLETPIAVGETLFGRDEFRRYLDAGAAGVLAAGRDAPGRTDGDPQSRGPGGGATIGRWRRTCCRKWRSTWRAGCRTWWPWNGCRGCSPPSPSRRGIVEGKIVPPPRPGLGLEMHPEAVAKYGA